jgi:hypothetical protein
MSARRSPFAPGRQIVDAVMDGYVSWREANAQADGAYMDWNRAPSDLRAVAFDRYQAALDREERAADDYRQLVELVGSM